MDFYRAYLMQVVSIHRVMFDRLLFEQNGALGPDLADLFQDVGKTYLQISKRINENLSSHHFLSD